MQLLDQVVLGDGGGVEELSACELAQLDSVLSHTIPQITTNIPCIALSYVSDQLHILALEPSTTQYHTDLGPHLPFRHAHIGADDE